MEFKFQEMFPLGKEKTEYHLLTKDHVSITEFEGKEILKVAPEGLRLLAKQAMHDIAFMRPPAHRQSAQSRARCRRLRSQSRKRQGRVR